MFLIGEAGSGKTFLAVALALRALQEEHLDKVYISRPVVEAGEKLGSLPGTADEKFAPFMSPISDTINKLVLDPKERKPVQKLFVPAPLAYMRGRTFSDCIAVLDEAQNASYTQLKLFLTRLGDNCKMIITGDPRQSDLPGRTSGLLDVVYALEDLPRVGSVFFQPEDCVRHPLVAQILKRL